jgi:hypothetical protein
MAYQIKDEVIADITRVALDGFDTGVSPLRMLEQAWGNEAFPMHCPEHHYMMPAVLLSAARRVKGDCRELLERDLSAAAERARNVLPGFCGWYGACGAAVGSGIFLSLLTDTSPYSEETWGKVNQLTSECLRDIATLGGPRCCKRVCFTALGTTAAFMRTHFGLDIGGWPKIRCAYHSRNAECKGVQCPYHREESGEA